MLKYINKNKKGFTLIELLVTVALLVSVLAIVVISVTNVSKKQKENAYEQVKEQAMTAAEQYFSTNEYYFEGMQDGTTASITVGKLVEEGFLNVLTDPTTGNTINKCSHVEITKNKGKYDFKFNELEQCDENNSVIVSEPNAIKGKIVFLNSAKKDKIDINDDGWLNQSELDEENKLLYICVEPEREGASIKINNNSTEKVSDKYYCIYKTSDFFKTPFSWEINYNGKITTGENEIGKDTIGPTITDETIVQNNVAKFKIKFSDETSGFESATLSNPKKNLYDDFLNNLNISSDLKYELTAYDNAGNTKTSSKTLAYVAPPTTPATISDDTPPLVTVNIYKVKSDGSKVLLTTKSGSGTDMNKGKNRIYVNEEKWMNNAEFPNGIYIEYYANEDLKSSNWYYNKKDLTTTKSKSDDYIWYAGEGYRNGGRSSDGAKAKYAKSGHNFKGDGARLARIYVKDLKENETKFYIVANFDKVVDTATINLSSKTETAENVTFTLSKPSSDISGVSKVQYSYDKSTWNDYSSKVTLLTTTGTKKVYARTIDKAGNISSIVESTGKCDKDGVYIGFGGNGMPFKLPITLKYPDSVSGITANKYEYYYWDAESTSDNTAAADKGGRAEKAAECKSSFTNIKNTYKPKTTTNGTITLYAKAKKQYYCFAVRPYRKNEISGINTWTVQGKHSEFSGDITSSKYNGVGTSAGNYTKK